MIGRASKNSEPGRIEKLRERQCLVSSMMATDSYGFRATRENSARIDLFSLLSLSSGSTDLNDWFVEGDENTKVGYRTVPLNS